MIVLWLFFAIFVIYAVMAGITEVGWAIKRAFPKNKNKNVRHRPF